MSAKNRCSIGLFEFLEEAELQKYYSSMKNILQVHSVYQLKYVVEDDLLNIGMSRPEARRLRTLYHKIVSPQNYASKLKRLVLRSTTRSRDELKHEFLLDEEEQQCSSVTAATATAAGGMGGTNPGGSSSRRVSKSLSNIKVPTEHIIPADAIAIHKELGAGEFGVVQQGVWTNEDQMRHQVYRTHDFSDDIS